MQKRSRIILVVTLMALAAAGGLITWQWQNLSDAYAQHRINAVTRSLQKCDRIEVFHLTGKIAKDEPGGFPVRPYGEQSQIIATRTLVGDEAEKLTAIWRSQSFGRGYGALCHIPGYGLRFYDGTSLQYETSVCFRCSNFYITINGDSFWWGFDTGSTSSAELLAKFQAVFPESKPKPKTN